MILNPRTYTVRRYATTNERGVIKETLVSSFEVSGNLQPMSARELRAFPEGFRARAAWKFYTEPDVELYAAELLDVLGLTYAPDRLVFTDGRELYVHGVKDYRHGVLPHKRWVIVEPETETGRGDAHV